MIQPKVYKKFSEVEQQIKDTYPQLVYKYRTWKDDNHKRLLTKQEAWFAHPFSLNDTNDIRRPIKINIEDFNSAQLIDKIWEAGRALNKDFTEEELAREVGYRSQQIKRDPSKYFKQNFDSLYNNRELYNSFGVFSTSQNGLSEEMWSSEEYSDNNKGYCVGFNTLELVRVFPYFIGEVLYNEDDLELKISDAYNNRLYKLEVLSKYPKWSFEQEIRLMTFDIRNELRIRHFPVKAVSEILIGKDASIDTEQEILYYSRKIYGEKIPIFKVVPSNTAFSLDKQRLI